MQECIFEDIQKLRGGKELPAAGNWKSQIYKFTQGMNPTKLEFLLILHTRLITFRRNLDQDSTIESKFIMGLIQNLHNLMNHLLYPTSTQKVEPEEKEREEQVENFLNKLNTSFWANQISYWPRILRREWFKSLRLEEDVIDKLFRLGEKFNEDLINSLGQSLQKLSTKLTQENLDEVIRNFSCGEWVFNEGALKLLENKTSATFVKALEEYSEQSRDRILTLDQLIQTAESQCLNSGNMSKFAKAKTIIEKVKENQSLDGKYKFKSPGLGKDRVNEMKIELAGWVKEMKGREINWKSPYGGGFPENVVVDLVSILYRTAELHFIEKEKKWKKPRDAQLLSLLLLIDGLGKERGRIGEIPTGEGKSLIVAMFAGFCAFWGAKVNVITSNKVLAETDADKFAIFYANLGLSVSNNCDSACKSDEDRTKRYNHNIIYGEVCSFQGDLLNTEFYKKGIDGRGHVDVVIVDEVDSLLLDKGANMLYLSHEIPELKYLRCVKLIIWEAVQRKKCLDAPHPKTGRLYTDNHLYSVKKYVEGRLKDDVGIRVPQVLSAFTEERLGIWIKNAFRARFMPVNEDFIVEEEKNNAVVNMDKDTGIEQANMQFSLGLQQFLQLRFCTKMSPESLKCVFMSNLNYFRKYLGNIYGISGTLGEEAELWLLKEKYGVDFFGVPQHKLSKRVEKPPIIKTSEGEWLDGIQQAVATHTTQPILIICENVARLNQIHKHLSKENSEGKVAKTDDKKIRIYKSSEKDTHFTDEIETEGGLTNTQIIISTNLAGRGTDITIAAACKKPGLHVILTFLPSNKRVEIQACGRTARAGESGSVQFVLKVNWKEDTATPFPSIETLTEQRKIRESNRISVISTRDIPRMDLEDLLFQTYSTLVNDPDCGIRRNRHFTKFPKKIQELQIKFLNNRWAIWLDSIQGMLENLHLQNEKGRETVLGKFGQFKQEMEEILVQSTHADARVFAQFPSELTQLGIMYERIAMKTAVNTFSKMEFGETGDIIEESFRNFGYALAQPFRVLVAEKTFAEICDEIVDYCIRPTNLETGLCSLSAAKERDEAFTEAASAFYATLSLQQNPMEKKLTNRDLKKSIKKIHQRIEQNNLCADLLLQSNVFRKVRNEEIPAQHFFKVQIDNENNLLQHHVDSILATLHADITPVSFNAVRQVESKQEAQEIFGIILAEMKQVIKVPRFKKKLNDLDFEALRQKFPFLTGDIQFVIEGKLGKEIAEDGFVSMVTTRNQFLELLLKQNLISHDFHKNRLINLNSENFQEYKNDQKQENFPKDFWEFREVILIHMYRNSGKIYNEEELFKILDAKSLRVEFTQRQRDSLCNFLTACNWLQEATFSATIIQENVEGVLTNFPEELKLHETYICQILWDKEKDCVREEIEFGQLNFPVKESQGSKEIFDYLVSNGFIKRHKIKFPVQYDHSEIQKQVDGVVSSTERIKPRLKPIFTKHHSMSKETMETRLKELKDTTTPALTSFSSYIKSFFYQEKNSVENILLAKLEQEEEFEKYFQDISNHLLNSIGSLKRYAKIRVNYEGLSSRLAVDNHQYSEELMELQREGIFDRIFTSDEKIHWFENPATFIFILGVAELALGVAMEVYSGGMLSPLAQILISEGGSDMYYSMKSLWKGVRLDGGDYLAYKKESMFYSTLSMGLFKGGRAGMACFQAIRNTFLQKFATSGLRVLLDSFIESNLNSAIDKNLMCLGTMMELVMNTAAFEQEIQQFSTNAKELHSMSYEIGQAEKYLEKLVNLEFGFEGKSSFDLSLEHMMCSVGKRFMQDTMRFVFKVTMPLNLSGMEGLFGVGQRGLANSCEEFTKLSVQVMKKLNQGIREKTERLRKEREDYLHKDEKSGAKVFEEFTNQMVTKIKCDLKKTLANKIYGDFTSPALQARLRTNMLNVYGTCTSMRTEFMETIIKEENSMRREVDDGDATRDHATEDMEAPEHRFVVNANNRTVKEVKAIIAHCPQTTVEIEFYENNFGSTFVNVVSTKVFMLSTEPNALDDHLNTMN